MFILPFDNNNIFFLEELSREGPYEINMYQDVDNNDEGDRIIDIAKSNTVDGTVQKSPKVFTRYRFYLKRLNNFVGKKLPGQIQTLIFLKHTQRKTQNCV